MGDGIEGLDEYGPGKNSYIRSPSFWHLAWSGPLDRRLDQLEFRMESLQTLGLAVVWGYFV